MENGRKKAHWTRFTTSRRIVRATRCAGKREQPQAFTLAIRDGLRAALPHWAIGCMRAVSSRAAPAARHLYLRTHSVALVASTGLPGSGRQRVAARGEAARMSLPTRDASSRSLSSGSSTATQDQLLPGAIVATHCWANRSTARPLGAALTSATAGFASGCH